ncbi:MAG: DUF86 domain-containing protein [Candidatus Eisenbacteria bacterium]|nr:DUF86 domain-containing protein [Candidatus Eisenbacteria bacterium]
MNKPDPLARDLVKCEDMRLNAERARRHLGSRTLSAFLSDALVQDAVIRCVEVIGEAARQVSGSSRQRAPAVPWTLIIGMRNILVHDYGEVDLEQVYRVAREHLPNLLSQLGDLIAELERDTGWQGEKDE